MEFAALSRAVYVFLAGVGGIPLASAQPTSPSDDSARLDVVHVTARHREERLIEVPDAITVLSGANVENSRILNVKDVAAHVANLSIVEAQQPGVGQINVRGVCQAHNGEPPVAVVIDGIQTTHPYQVTRALLDIDRIEVLKGPQGAVYGRNAIGGAFNISTREPTRDFEGMARVGAGSDSDRSTGAALSGPLVQDHLLFRLAADYRDFDGDIASPNTPGRPRANGETDRNVRLRLLALPSSRTRIHVHLSRLDTDAGSAWYSPVPPGQSKDAPRPFLGNVPGTAKRTLTDAAVKADVQFERATFTSVSSFARVAARVRGDADFTSADGQLARQQLDAANWSQELRLTSNDSGPFKWLGGVYFLNVHQRLDTEIYLGADFLPIFGLPPTLSPFLVASTRTTDNNQAYAAFGQASYRWASGVDLTLALRYDSDHRHQLDRATSTPTAYEDTFGALQPKVSLAWIFAPNQMAYATAGKGFRSGGFNPQDRITRIYKAETNLSYEIGWKATMLEDRVSLTAAAFHTRIDDRQVYTLDVINSAQTLSNPIPKAHAQGLELEVAARPVAALEVGASLGLTRSRIDRYDTSVFAGLPVAGDFTGNKLPQTPEYSYATYTQYRLSLRSGIALTPRLEWQGSAGDYFWEIDNRDKRHPQNFLNTRLTAERSGWRITAFLENALNQQHIIEYLPVQWSGLAAGDVSAAGRGRHWGVDAAYRF